MGTQFQPQDLYDYLGSFLQGMNSGIDPELLPKDQLADCINGTVRGTFVKPRPPFKTITLTYSVPSNQTQFERGLFQGAGYYKPDQGAESLFASIGGRLFQFTPGTTTASVTDQSIVGDLNSATEPQAWLWQAEQFLINNNGVQPPIFFDGYSSRRSGGGNVPAGTVNMGLGSSFVVPAVGSSVAIGIYNPTGPNISNVGVNILVGGKRYTSLGFIGDPSGYPSYTNINDTPGNVVTNGTAVALDTNSHDLPVGRMGCYGLGRNWMALDDHTFIASDIVGGSSGTAKYAFRDSPLKVTENTYLNGGGNFKVPSSGGDIRSMTFSSVLDVSLGQGPLMIGTPSTVFSLQIPVDRSIWQNYGNNGLGMGTNLILAEALKTNGTQGQSSTINMNGDLTFRSVDGIRSLVIGRRDFATWGNVPQSREIEATLSQDATALLKYSSSVVFDNRMLMTASPVQSALGVYHTKLVALNLDPISSLRGKAPSVYDGIWTGLNVLQLVIGTFSGVERCFAFCLSADLSKIELHEILKSATSEYVDDASTSIPLDLSSGTLDFGQTDKRKRPRKCLRNGEIWVDNLDGDVTFTAYYKADQWPSWVLWHSWRESNGISASPGFRPRMGLGEPDPKVYDVDNDRPLREGYEFQFRLVITGKCVFKGARFHATTCAEPSFAKPKP